jgi:predicted ester cyclase
MNKIEIARSAFTYDNPDKTSHLSDDFQSTDALGSPPMDRSSWIAMGQPMESAFPDINYIIEDIREEGDGVAITGRFSGTFTSDFDLSVMGMGVIPATGAAVDFPSSTLQLSFDGDKISRVHNPSTEPDAGIAGWLKALGADMG